MAQWGWQVQFEVGRCPIKELSTSQKGSEGKILGLAFSLARDLSLGSHMTGKW